MASSAVILFYLVFFLHFIASSFSARGRRIEGCRVCFFFLLCSSICGRRSRNGLSLPSFTEFFSFIHCCGSLCYQFISLLLLIGLFLLVLPSFTEFSRVAALPGVTHVVPSFSLSFIAMDLCITY